MHDLAAPYALGSLSDTERAGFEAHLADCAACRDEVRVLRDVTGLLAYGARDAAPPASLRARVLAEATRVRPIAAARRRMPVSWVAAAAAAVLVALAATVQAVRTAGSARRLGQDLAGARAALAARDSALDALLGPRVHMVQLAAGGDPQVRVFWNHARNVFLIDAFGLPEAPAGRRYQLWALADGRPPISMGLFANDAGRTTALLAVPDEVSAAGFIKLCALTLEPEGGSPQPTETPRLTGAWIHSD